MESQGFDSSATATCSTLRSKLRLLVEIASEGFERASPGEGQLGKICHETIRFFPNEAYVGLRSETYEHETAATRKWKLML